MLLLYGVSGSGKTRTIEHHLHNHWGYYLLPGNLNSTTQPIDGNLYDPRVEKGHSKDSCFLWGLIQNVDDVMPGMDNHKVSIAEWSNRLILSRHLIFNMFLKVTAQNLEAQNPAKWLEFQKSCSTFDPFETLFKLLLLFIGNFNSYLDLRFPDLMFDLSNLNSLLRKKPFYYCLDEAQCYLDTPIPIRTPSEDNNPNLLGLVCTEILLVPYKDARLIVSGTSLELQKTASTITSIRQSEGRKMAPTKYKTFTDFPLLTSGEQLRSLVKERGLLVEPEGLLELVEKYGVPLQGRYLWSSRYVDRLKELMGPLDKDVISNAAEDTIKEAKDSLKERLSRLQDERKDEILKELCRVVIQSELLDRPTIFQKDTDHTMITEAFAVVETQKHRGILQERLAMEAAKEWFWEKSGSMYREIFGEYLRFSANDASSFGKAAEWFLALVGTDTHVICNIC